MIFRYDFHSKMMRDSDGSSGTANSSDNDNKKGTGNTLVETLANLFTPNNDTEYVDGDLVKKDGKNTLVNPAPPANPKISIRPRARPTGLVAPPKENTNRNVVAPTTTATQPNVLSSMVRDMAMGRINFLSGGAFGDEEKGRAALLKADYTVDEIDDYYKRTDATIARNKIEAENTNSNNDRNGGSSPVQPASISKTMVGSTAPSQPTTLAGALNARDNALAGRQNELDTLFGFATPDYYSNLKNTYMDNSGDAFNNAYDSSVQGVYDSYKSAGLLSQGELDKQLASLGERGASSAPYADQYITENKNYVQGGQRSIMDALKAFSTDTNDMSEVQKQTASINNYDIVGASKPYQTPTEITVGDYLKGTAKGKVGASSSYNVSPKNVAGGGSRASNSVTTAGVNTQPSTLSGIRSPYGGSSIRRVNS